MSMSDPVADLLTRMRNSLLIKKAGVRVPFSKIKANILNALMREGYVKSYEVLEDGNKRDIFVHMKFTNNNDPVLSHMKRVSTPGCRRYLKVGEIRPVLNGLGIAVLSTSKGVLSDRECREQKVGGEILCELW
ncbi:MAG: 30S ribosomal protein S8 [Planctomycetes bacterium]|nr:30S ribosomal protein S8 [Planctomycetota bacterium]